MNFVVRWFVTAVAVGAAVWLVPGISATGDGLAPVAVAALALAFIDSCVKPVVKFLSFPVTFLTLGLFALVINALMLELASWMSADVFGSGIVVSSFGAAVLGAIIISIVSAFMNGVVGKDS